MSESTNAFKDDKKVDDVSFFEYVSIKFREKFVNNIPSESILELPPKFIIPVGVIAYLASFSCFFYFAYTAYNIQRKQQFISLSEDDGQCESVALPITGDFVATSEGVWEGSQNFHAQFGKYTLKMVEYVSDDSGFYADMMTHVLPGINNIAALSLTYDAMENLLLWMTWSAALITVPNGSNAKDALVMNGDPRFIFNKAHLSGMFANEHAECDMTSTSVSFDMSTGIVSYQLDYDSFQQSAACNTTATLEYMGYSSVVDHGRFSANLNVLTLVVAAAVNRGIISENDLIVINGSVTLFPAPNSGEIVEFSQRYHPNYPGMQLLTCILFPGLPRRFCVMAMDDTIGYPVMNHNGNGDISSPTPCDCSKDKDRAPASPCHEHNLLFGALFYNLPSTQEAIETGQNPQLSNQFAIAQLLLKLGLGNIDTLSYNASFAASRPGEFLDPTWRKNAYDFCQLPGFGGCSLVMFHTYETGKYFVNRDFYAVRTPACADSFSVPDDMWKALATTPPTRLTQTYLACTARMFDAIFNSIGISIGNVQFWVPLFMLLVLPLVYFYLLGIGHVPPKREYEKEEYEASLHAFANIMLRLRDGKSRNLVKNGILDKLVKELKKAATKEGGYPDSDDDSDSDSDDESDSEDGDEEITGADPTVNFGSHNVFKRVSATKRPSTVSAKTAQTSDAPKRLTMLRRLSGGLSTTPLRKTPDNSSSSSAASKDIEMGSKTTSAAKIISTQMLKQERRAKRLSAQMQKLAVTIVNAPVGATGKGKRRCSTVAGGEMKVVRNKDKIAVMVTEAHEAMDKAYRVRSIDGFLDVYRVAAKKCAALASVDLDFVRNVGKLHELATLHTCLLLQCKKEDLVGPILDSYAYQFYSRHESIRQLRILAAESENEDEGGGAARRKSPITVQNERVGFV